MTNGGRSSSPQSSSANDIGLLYSSWPVVTKYQTISPGFSFIQRLLRVMFCACFCITCFARSARLVTWQFGNHLAPKAYMRSTYALQFIKGFNAGWGFAAPGCRTGVCHGQRCIATLIFIECLLGVDVLLSLLQEAWHPSLPPAIMQAVAGCS